MSYISFENVKKEYKMGEVTIKAVDGVDFTVDKGEFTIIVGPSGAGKTTVLNMLGGMDACSGGVITVDGARVSGYNASNGDGNKLNPMLVTVMMEVAKYPSGVFHPGLAVTVCFHPVNEGICHSG